MSNTIWKQPLQLKETEHDRRTSGQQAGDGGFLALCIDPAGLGCVQHADSSHQAVPLSAAAGGRKKGGRFLLAFTTPPLSNSSPTTSRNASSCRNSAGCATAIVGRRRHMAPHVYTTSSRRFQNSNAVAHALRAAPVASNSHSRRRALRGPSHPENKAPRRAKSISEPGKP